MTLLDHCANTLEEITLDIPQPEEILTTDGSTSTYTSRIHDSIDMLPSLPNLRKICWGWTSSTSPAALQSHFVWAIATKQLCSLTSPCKITEVGFCIPSLGDLEKAKDHFTTIDKVLTGNKFPSLTRVKLLERIYFDYFPILKSHRLLESGD